MQVRARARAGAAVAVALTVLAGCAPVTGYPKDPENTDVTLANLQPYFDGTQERLYFAEKNAALRKQKRNEIIFARLHAYDIKFADFEQKLYGDGNAVSLGSDLIGLVLGGLTATTGNAATKSALGAASVGVIGANTAINKDLYYQKTIPALLAQMEADRLQAKMPIVAGVKLADADYTLMQAYIDLDTYKNAGSIPAAINAINRDTGAAKDEALEALRTGSFSNDASRQRLLAYIWPSGVDKPADNAHFAALRRWMSANLPKGAPVEVLLDDPRLAGKRALAITDLAVP